MLTLLGKRLRPTRKNLIIGLIACLFAIIGSLALLQSKAATPASSVEAENGTTTGSAQRLPDSAASAGNSVKFSAGSVTVKPVITGFLDNYPRYIRTSAGYRNTVKNVFINLTWAEVQPTKNGPINRKTIDDKINVLKNLNPQVKIRLRVIAGVDSPDWVKTDAGIGTFIIYKPANGSDSAAYITVPKFWTPQFKTYYDSLQSKLANIYDDPAKEPLAAYISDVTINRCMTQFAEPFVRNIPKTNEPNPDYLANFEKYYRAGFTTALDKQCHREQIQTHAASWKHTRSSLAHNPYRSAIFNADSPLESTSSNDYAFTKSMMDYCRDQLGSRCVLQNNSIRWPRYPDAGYCTGAPAGDTYNRCFMTSGDMGSLYSDILSRGSPTSFQSAQPVLIGDWEAVFDWLASRGANSIELNSDGVTYPLSVLGRLQTKLESNATR